MIWTRWSQQKSRQRWGTLSPSLPFPALYYQWIGEGETFLVEDMTIGRFPMIQQMILYTCTHISAALTRCSGLFKNDTKSGEGILEHIEKVNGEKYDCILHYTWMKFSKIKGKSKIGLTMNSWMVYLGIYSEKMHYFLSARSFNQFLFKTNVPFSVS